ncbi:hypothetical protein WME98_50140 [Sorangium sp. So ce296]|uniref:hypothetical protein n=1 Tax=Sorangium sp. So ce296 TaxID=3133296 RepID=UPI003F60FAE0
MMPVDLDERAREALAAAWASRRPGRARQVLLAAPAGQAIAADVARLPGARAAGGVVIAVVAAAYAERLLDAMYGFRGDEVREANPARVLVVLVEDEDAAVAYLDEVRGSAEGAGEEEPMARSTSAAAAPAPEELEADTGARELRAEVLEVFAEAQGHAHEDAMEAWAARRRARGGTRLTGRKGRAMATTTKKTTTPAAAPQIQAAPAPEKPTKKKKAKKGEKRQRYGRGQSFFSSRIPVEKSRIQIQDILQRYGADKFGYMHDNDTNVTTIQFRCRSRLVRFSLELPREESFREEVRCYNGKRLLPDDAVKARYERALRARWRAIVTAVRSKLVLVEFNISSWEDAWLAETVDPESGMTVGELIRERRLLPGLPPAVSAPPREALPPARRRGIVEARAQ